MTTAANCVRSRQPNGSQRACRAALQVLSATQKADVSAGADGAANWLGDQDSNLDNGNQNPGSYH